MHQGFWLSPSRVIARPTSKDVECHLDLSLGRSEIRSASQSAAINIWRRTNGFSASPLRAESVVTLLCQRKLRLFGSARMRPRLHAQRVNGNAVVSASPQFARKLIEDCPPVPEIDTTRGTSLHRKCYFDCAIAA